jgi:hypothetical protein
MGADFCELLRDKLALIRIIRGFSFSLPNPRQLFSRGIFPLFAP